MGRDCSVCLAGTWLFWHNGLKYGKISWHWELILFKPVFKICVWENIWESGDSGETTLKRKISKSVKTYKLCYSWNQPVSSPWNFHKLAFRFFAYVYCLLSYSTAIIISSPTFCNLKYLFYKSCVLI